MISDNPSLAVTSLSAGSSGGSKELMTLVTVPSASHITAATACGDATADGYYYTAGHATAAGTTTAVGGMVEPASAFEEPPVSRQRRETEELLLAVNSSVLLRILSDVSLSAEDLARLELVCGFFRRPAHLTPHPRLSLAEVAAHDRCQQHSLRFRMLPPAQQRLLWARCGRSWKLLLRFLITSDSCIRHGQPQVAAGCAHSVAVGRGGEVWTFGHGSAGQLGRPLASASSAAAAAAAAGAGAGGFGAAGAGGAAAGGGYASFAAAAAAAAVGGFAGLANDVTTTLATTATGAVTVTLRSGIERGVAGSGDASAEPSWKPQIVRSLLGVRVVQAAAGRARTMLVSDTGSVYHFGRDCFGDQEYSLTSPEPVTEPRLVESLRQIQVVQVALGNFFTAVLSAEGRVFTLSWDVAGSGGAGAGSAGCGGCNCIETRRETDKMGDEGEEEEEEVEEEEEEGGIVSLPVVQIAGGHCYLLGLTCATEPHGRSVWSIGCGLGGKLGHGTKYDERRPKEIAHFKALEFAPTAVAAGAWHAAAVAADGRVATWGWGRHGCLGHGKDQCETLPRVIESLCKKEEEDMNSGVNGGGGVGAGATDAAGSGGAASASASAASPSAAAASPSASAASPSAAAASTSAAAVSPSGSEAAASRDEPHGSRGKLRPAVKACHVAAGDYTTFVVGEGGEVWSFGSAESACLGHGGGWEREEEEEGEEIDDADLHDIVSNFASISPYILFRQKQQALHQPVEMVQPTGKFFPLLVFLSLVCISPLPLSSAGAPRIARTPRAHEEHRRQRQLDEIVGRGARPRVHTSEDSSAPITYGGGPVMTGNPAIKVYIIYYGSWPAGSGQKIIENFIRSLSADSQRQGGPADPKVKRWWAISAAYTQDEEDGTKKNVSSKVRLARTVYDDYSAGTDFGNDTVWEGTRTVEPFYSLFQHDDIFLPLINYALA
ncbi:unnamed protein product [Closterium sp. Yama58-4]|nr:unnamed protein product [Closterium sp. Yama58-4]